MKKMKTKNGKFLQVITEAVYEETKQEMVVYQELEEPFSVYVSEKEKFLQMIEEVPASAIVDEMPVFQEDKKEQEFTAKSSLIEEFLEAETYSKKIEVLESQEEKIPEETMELLALTMDAVLEGDTADMKFYSLMQVLRTKARFEVDR